MPQKKRRRALSAEEASMTAAQRAEMREIGFRARVNAQSSRYQREVAIEKSIARTNGPVRQEESKK